MQLPPREKRGPLHRPRLLPSTQRGSGAISNWQLVVAVNVSRAAVSEYLQGRSQTASSVAVT